MTTNTASNFMLQNLAVKATAMNGQMQQRALRGSIASVAYDSTTPENVRIKLRTAMQKSVENEYRQLHAEAKSSMIPVDQQIAALRAAPLTEKRELLDALPIIPVPVGAAFLGVAEADLHDVNSQGYGVFGDAYLRRRCNSMNELLLISQNPGWLRYHPEGSPALVLSDTVMLYAITYVDVQTACAYLNMRWDEVTKQVPANGRYYRYDRTYRVSDLEEFRVAKLKAKQV
ncbi:hypothetical protein LE190_10870 [Massilia oculi]|uniref:Uncharacterized protein n=1 Tax=Massilia hydrophila TaxID=3044279 RepID=A0ABS7Y9R6_9BURK|nr:hypothetical protein [Massilia oculi]MCA1856418.1 hypothetical protein [Massilia oculi]